MENAPEKNSQKRSFRPAAIFLAVGAVLVVTIAVGYLAVDPFQKPFGDGSGRLDDIFHFLFQDLLGGDKPAKENPEIAACSKTCDKIMDCGLLPDSSMCLPWCIDEWTASVQECIANAACDRIDEACFPKTDREICREVCDHVAGCEWMSSQTRACPDLCLGEWSREERDCLLSTDCAGASDHCIDLIARVPCPQVCDKLDACGQITREEFPACVQMCEEEMESSERDCILSYECGEMRSVCMEGNLPENLCNEACSIVVSCDLAPVTEDECLLVCEEEWSEDLALCVVENESCEDATECFAEPGVPCPEFCRFLVECNQFEEVEYGVCVDTCPDEFSEEERECVMAADCSAVQDCLRPAREAAQRRADCPDACSKLASCRLITMTDQLNCVDACLEDWSDIQLKCVLDGQCNAIGRECLARPSLPIEDR